MSRRSPAPPAADDGDIPAPRVLRPADPGYPAALQDLPDPPATLHVLGDWPRSRRRVAIVGSRAATAYGRDTTHRIASDLASLGVVVVSGLARGIDRAAHEGAHAGGGHTVAVLPTGLDAIVPPEHRDLAQRIATRGALVSEIPPATPLARHMFVKRNRIIAALGEATLVAEAAARSGALSTAAAARRMGRPVLAVPGDVDRPTSRGCHALLREGARVCEQAADVMRALGPPHRSGGDDSPESRLTRVLGRPRTPEALARAAGLDVRTTLRALVRLEWAGLARRHPGSRWVAARDVG